MTHAAAIVAGITTPHALRLRILDVSLTVLTNDADLLARLDRYYAPYSRGTPSAAGTVITLVQGPPPRHEGLAEVPRRPGQVVKEAVRDVAGGRLILKRTTGVLMALWPGHAAAVGDLRANLNQAINLINACYAKAHLADGFLLFHAAGVVRDGRAVMLAGPPGTGKSTAALRLLEAGFRFLSNDRVLARADADGVEVRGYPKQPRVNPGTLLHHPRLRRLLDRDERRRLRAWPAAGLRALEAKRDVDVEALYGPGTVQLRARLAGVVLLTWVWEGEPFTATLITAEAALSERDLFAKNLGVFDLDAPPAGSAGGDSVRYATLLERVPITTVSGRVDFDGLVAVVDDTVVRSRKVYPRVIVP